MKIGAYILAKNEAENICRVIKYHLDIQEIDLILLVDNGSTDDTVKKVKSLKAPRIIIRRTEANTGYRQDVFSIKAANELFDIHKCDWVLPIDADEYWHSIHYGTVRKALQSISVPLHGIYTYEYRFFESCKDKKGETLFLKRLLHARVTGSKKVLINNIASDNFELAFGNHDFYLAGGEQQVCFVMEPSDLVRFHYPHISKKDLINRTLNQVEGFLVFSKGTWLDPNLKSRLGGHVWQRYHQIREGTFDEDYYKKLFLSEETIEKGLKDGSIHYIDEMLKIIPEDF